ncbi:hypothetical protein BG015_011301 [Linnemannia schmuckeri]|uniref:Inhibitor I9 domain-containing protein n=1 Tax=Linnemannia schmuckeri TaxID=64567 RepID=A0A9P5RT91_9FUNG|nr:hypothetical protein BG015_011301 [Linnemannia schmuckeri]
MKFTTVIALLAAVAAVASAALPVEPAINGFVIQDNTPSTAQQIVIDTDHSNKPAQTQETKSYIVVFKDTAMLQAMENVEKEILAFGGKIGQRYSAALKGFSAWIPGPIVTALSTNPFIDYIEEDGEVNAFNAF